MLNSYDVFISYRRDGGDNFGYLLYKKLTEKGYRVFYDVESLRSGKFNKQLYDIIDNCKDFIVICSPHAWDRTKNEGDWVRLEIEHAVDLKKNIIPVVLEDFTYNSNEVPKKIQKILKNNKVDVEGLYFDAIVLNIIKYLEAPKNISDTKNASNILTRESFQKFINSIKEKDYQEEKKKIEEKKYDEEKLPELFEELLIIIKEEEDNSAKDFFQKVYNELLLIYLLAIKNKFFDFEILLESLNPGLIVNAYDNPYQRKVFDDEKLYKISYMSDDSIKMICYFDFLLKNIEERGFDNTIEILEMNQEDMNLDLFRKIILNIKEDDYQLALEMINDENLDSSIETKYKIISDKGLFAFYKRMETISRDFVMDEDDEMSFKMLKLSLNILSHITGFMGLKVFNTYVFSISSDEYRDLVGCVDVIYTATFSLEDYINKPENIEFYMNNPFLNIISEEREEVYKSFVNVLIHIEMLIKGEKHDRKL